MEIREISSQLFKEYADTNIYTTFYQSEPFTNMIIDEGWQHLYLGGYENDIIQGATIILGQKMFGKYKYYCAVKGYLIDYSNQSLIQDFTIALKKFLIARNGLYLRINPAFLVVERDANGDIVEGGFDHHSWIDSLVTCGYTHEGYTKGFFANAHVRWIYVLDLFNQNVDTLKAGMSKLTKRNLKNVEKYHVRVHEITKIEDLNLFLEIMQHTADRRSFQEFSKQYYENQFMNFQKDDNIRFLYAAFYVKEYIEDLTIEIQETNNKIIQLEATIKEKGENDKLHKKIELAKESIHNLDKKKQEAMIIQKDKGDVFPISTANFILFHKEITYFHGGSYSEYMHYCGQFALQWYMIQYGLSHEFTRFNFNGISGIFDETAPDIGVYQFKKGFGGHVEEYVGYFHMPLQTWKYEIYRIVDKVKRTIKK